MFASGQKSTGTEYTTTVAFLVVAFIFSPAILIFFRPFGYVSVSLAIACSALCVALAWVNWKRSSQLTIPSITGEKAAAK
jgi:flagellar biosynthesis protein FliP